MRTVLKVRNITKVYKKGAKASLKNVSFDVREGEFIGIMGASGSGKTTLLNVLSTIDSPTAGEVSVNGVSLNSLSDAGSADFRRDNLGFIFQEYFLLDSLTVRENIAVPLTLQKLPPEKIEKKIRNLAEKFQIISQLDKYPSELSGGQQQRVSAARAIIKDPGILFADEPTGALDSASATALLKTLSRANRELGTTILMVTHDAYAASFAGRILMFRDGRIITEMKRPDSGNGSGRMKGSRSLFYERIMEEVARLDTSRQEDEEAEGGEWE